MPELPEVHALAADLSSRLGGRTVERLDMTSFTALKTFDPPATALSGAVVEAVVRHGKFLDFRMATDPGMELPSDCPSGPCWLGALAGRSPPKPARPGKGQLAARLVLDEDSAVDFTEAGTKKSLALWLVPDPLDVPQVAGLGPDPLREDFTAEQLAEILQRAGRAQIKGVLRSQSTIAGIGNAYSDEILHAAGVFLPGSGEDRRRGTVDSHPLHVERGGRTLAGFGRSRSGKQRRKQGCASTAGPARGARSAQR